MFLKSREKQKILYENCTKINGLDFKETLKYTTI